MFEVMSADDAGLDPLVYVIVITWNGSDHLEKCLPSLARTDYSNYRVLLVDNGSSDGSTARARELSPSIEVISLARNLGFAAGNNRGMAWALNHGAAYVVLLNDDTEIIDAAWLSQAVDVAQSSPHVGMVGFQIVNSLIGLPDSSAPPMTTVSHIPGCALLIKASLLERVGCFDEVYVNYFEEDDLEARAQRAGYRLVRIDARIYHRSGATSSRHPLRTQYYSIRNSIRFSIKNRSFWRTLLRCSRLVDICGNPWPISFIQHDEAHRRARGKNLLVNLLVLVAAMVSNLARLPQTLLCGLRDEQRVKLARRTTAARRTA